MDGLKAFVSETELEEQRKQRQEEWEKVRTADQPAGNTLYTTLDFRNTKFQNV